MGEQRDFYNIKKEGFLSERQRSVEEAVSHLEKRFTEARPGLRQLAERLNEPFRTGAYDAIVGEDKAGRLPTLFVKHFAERVSDEAEQESPQVFFVAGGRHLSVPEQRDTLQKYIETLKPRIQRRALLVSEHVAGGASLSHLAESFERAGIPFDIAAVSLQHPEEAYRTGDPQARLAGLSASASYGGRKISKEEAWSGATIPENVKIFSGDSSAGDSKEAHGLAFHTAQEASGVWTTPATGEATTMRNWWARPEVVSVAREKMKQMADEIYDELNPKEETSKAA